MWHLICAAQLNLKIEHSAWMLNPPHLQSATALTSRDLSGGSRLSCPEALARLLRLLARYGLHLNLHSVSPRVVRVVGHNRPSRSVGNDELLVVEQPRPMRRSWPWLYKSLASLRAAHSSGPCAHVRQLLGWPMLVRYH